MGLALPVVSVEPGPTWASDLNTAFGLVDSHDHTSGKGLQIPTAGLNINADLSIGSFNLTTIRSARYNNQSSPLGVATDLNCVYVSSGNLYFNNSTGVQVQITSGAGLNAASIGGIGGDYTTSTALEFYTTATKTFTFWQNTNTYANIECGNLLIHEPAVSTNSITLKSPTSLGSSYIVTLPTSNGSDGYALRSIGSGVTMFHPFQSMGGAINYSLVASVSANALTIALKGADGNDPSATNKVTLEFKNSTSATGTPSFGDAAAVTSLVVSSGSTLGHANGVNEFIHVYALNNAGVVELACSSTRYFNEATVQTSTAEGGAGAADSRVIVYSTTARSNVGFRYLGRIKVNEATAGTWASAPTEISLVSSNISVQEISEVSNDSGNGFGSTNNKIRRFTNTTVNTGSAITYADSATLGASYTINEEGEYWGLWSDNFSGGSSNHGISVNSTQLTTSILTITPSTQRVALTSVPASLNVSCSFQTRLHPGDVVRPHSQLGNEDDTGVGSYFRIKKIRD